MTVSGVCALRVAAEYRQSQPLRAVATAGAVAVARAAAAVSVAEASGSRAFPASPLAKCGLSKFSSAVFVEAKRLGGSGSGGGDAAGEGGAGWKE